MRAASRRVVAVVVLTVALALHAGETCEPPDQPVLDWLGLVSGCTAANLVPCLAGETITFSVRPFGGTSYPACVTYEWFFGDGGTSTQPAPLYVYAGSGAFFVSVQVRAGDFVEFDGRPLLIIPATVVPLVDSFAASATIIRRGRTVELTWSTRNATSVRINPLGVTLPATTTRYSFAPAVTQTYQLIAGGTGGTTPSDPVTITVNPPRRRRVRH